MMWFKQLGRFQSYWHSILAGQFHENAVQYRIELWTAIRRAKGFQVSFVHWWQQQDFDQVLGPFADLPSGCASCHHDVPGLSPCLSAV